MKTITGLDLIAAFHKLDDCLPPKAYKEITGGKGGKMGLTDINPGFLPPLLLDLFGPCGYGWGYDLISMHTKAQIVKRNSGYEEEEFISTCEIRVWYRFDLDGQIIKSDPIPARGGSTNTQIEWAEKGAITYALGTAWFMAGYQVAVYKGERSHKDFGGGSQKQQPQQTQPSHPTFNREAVNNNIRNLLHRAGCKDAQQAGDMVAELTTFKGKDGNMVAGKRDYKALSDKAAEILVKSLEKIVTANAPQEREVCHNCGADLVGGECAACGPM